MNRIVLPGATLGVLGSGQLGRMFAIAARRMGYRVHTLSPGFDTPTGQVADVEIDADYDDLDAIRAFARGVDVITFEFENVSTAAADAAAEIVPVRPSGHALHVTQQRAREKAFLRLKGFPVTPFESGRSRSRSWPPRSSGLGCRRSSRPPRSATTARASTASPRRPISSAVWALVGHQTAVLERVVDFVLEFSVVAARGLDGAFAHYGAIENTHRDHILDLSVAPARVPPPAVAEAVAVTQAIMEELAYVGVLCVEFFLTADGKVLVNEIAPRPHNSAHLTIDACVTSQFEQQVRAMCGLPLGDRRRSCARPRCRTCSATSGSAASRAGTRPWPCPT